MGGQDNETPRGRLIIQLGLLNSSFGRLEATMETEKARSRIIYSQRMAGYLMQRGFVLINMREDLQHPRRNVFFFKESPELSDAIGDFLETTMDKR